MKIMKKNLINGIEIPQLFLGPGVVKDSMKAISIVEKSLNLGFDGFETSSAYSRCEEAIGEAIKRFDREKLFITTKISNHDQRTSTVAEAIRKSKMILGVEYIDLYLMHWPQTGTFLETWKKMEDAYDKGLVKAIGVCNFHIHHFEELFQISNIKPMVHQFEIHPLFTQEELRKFCINQDIQIMAYTPTGRCDDRLMNNGILNDISFRTNKTIVQVILRWHLQKGHIPVVRTFKVKHLKENINIFDFELSQKEIEQIDSININSRLRYDSDNCDFYRL